MNQVALITGAAGGIGNAAAKIFAAAGWHTIGVDNVLPAENNGLNRFVRINLCEASAIRSLFEDLEKKEDRLDALINNAAVQLVKPLIATEPEEWDRIMAINVRAAYLTIKYAHPLLRIRGGSIVNISSVHAVATSENLAAYVTSKGALTAMTRAAALELARDNIRVNAVLPGAIDTNLLRTGLSRDHLATGSMGSRLKEFGEKHSLGRVGKPEEIGEAILFLSDPARSGYMTGQTMIIDGGATARLSTE